MVRQNNLIPSSPLGKARIRLIGLQHNKEDNIPVLKVNGFCCMSKSRRFHLECIERKGIGSKEIDIVTEVSG